MKGYLNTKGRIKDDKNNKEINKSQIPLDVKKRGQKCQTVTDHNKKLKSGQPTLGLWPLASAPYKSGFFLKKTRQSISNHVHRLNNF